MLFPDDLKPYNHTLSEKLRRIPKRMLIEIDMITTGFPGYFANLKFKIGDYLDFRCRKTECDYYKQTKCCCCMSYSNCHFLKDEEENRKPDSIFEKAYILYLQAIMFFLELWLGKSWFRKKREK